MKILVLCLLFLIVSISALAQNSSQDKYSEIPDTTAIQPIPVEDTNAVPVVSEKSTTPVPAEIQLVEPKSNSGIKEDE